MPSTEIGGVPSPGRDATLLRVLDLERPTVRRGLILALLAAAFLSPNIGLPHGLPAIRIEQLLLAVSLPSLILYLTRHPERRGIGPIDLTLALAVAVFTVSTVLAPVVVPSLGRSYHDLFDSLRPVEYWLLYRLALLWPAEGRSTSDLLVAGALMGVAGGALAIAQRFGPNAFNNAVTAIWTSSSHNLAGVISGGRPVGTIGNANSFGFVCGLVLLPILVAWIARDRPSGRAGRLVLAGAVLATIGLVLSQSRSASLATAGAATLGILAMAATRMRLSLVRPLLAIGTVAAITVGVVAATPPAHSSSIVTRFNPVDIGDDTSLVVRLARLQVVFAHPDPTLVHRLSCETGSPAAIRSGHEPQPLTAVTSGTATGSGTDSSSTTDQQRKADVAAIAGRVVAAYCSTGAWPTGSVDALYGGAGAPRDPVTGLPYDVRLGPDGYSVSATLQNGDDPEGPIYTLSSSPDLVTNPSFESRLATWQPGTGTTAAVVSPGRFGTSAIRVDAGPQAELHQYVMYSFAPGSVYTAQVWARAADGTSTKADLVLNGWLTNGDRISPLAEGSATLPASGRWVPITVSFTIPNGSRVWVIEFGLAPGDTGSRVDFDGASLSAGAPAPSFSSIQEVNPASMPTGTPSFWDSPLIGLGSLSNFELGAFDNEYAYVLVHFGLVGLLAYLALFLATLWTLLSAWRASRRAGRGSLALGLAAGTAALLAFDLAAGAFFNYQIMAIYWLLAGVALACARGTEPVVRSIGSERSTGG